MSDVKRIRILLTENCNANCTACFNKDIRVAKNMDTETARLLFDGLSTRIPGLKIMGGEPTIHPDFLDIYEYAQKKFRYVGLFTNAINDKVLKISPREGDTIIYNLGLIGSNFDFQKLLPEHKCRRVFETMLSSSDNMVALFSRIRKVVDGCEKVGVENSIKFNITLNCVENIFDDGDILNEKWRALVEFISGLHPQYLSFDHCVPRCFWTKKSAEFIKERSLQQFVYATCRPGCYGLINSSFKILHCNQYPKEIGDAVKIDAGSVSVITPEHLAALLYRANQEKVLINLRENNCIECEHALVDCTGGCFMHKYAPKQPDPICKMT